MKQVVWAFAAIAVLAMLFHEPELKQQTFRYKLTINVTVDGTPYSASSVIEATQTRASSWWFGVSGSGAGGGVYPRFEAKGVAPMITLPDGAVIFASLRGFYSDNPPGVRGAPASRLPWLIYVDTWWAGVDTSKYKNLPVVPLPKETPRVEIPFEGHPKSKFRPVMWYVPPQEQGPPLGREIGPSVAAKYSGRDLVLERFAIEPTKEPLREWLDPAPSWMNGYRSGKGYTRKQLDEQRTRMIGVKSAFYPPNRARIETSTRTLAP